MPETEPYWDDTLLRATVRRVGDWWSEHHLLSLGITTGVELVISIGFFSFVGVNQGLASLVVVPLLMFVALVIHTHLRMVREARQAIGRLRNPEPDAAAEVASVRNFTVEVVEDSPPGQVQVRVRNRDAAGEFSAKVMSVEGVDTNGTWPITARWHNAPEARSREIGQGDSEVISLVRVRTRRAVDFLRPTTSSKEYQRVAVSPNGSSATVRAHLRVFNRRNEVEGHQSRWIELTFTDGDDEPRASLGPDISPGGG
jgi:hypothetical protein